MRRRSNSTPGRRSKARQPHSPRRRFEDCPFGGSSPAERDNVGSESVEFDLNRNLDDGNFRVVGFYSNDTFVVTGFFNLSLIETEGDHIS